MLEYVKNVWGMTCNNNNNKKCTRTWIGVRRKHKQRQPQQVGKWITSIYAKINDVNEIFRSAETTQEQKEELATRAFKTRSYKRGGPEEKGEEEDQQKNGQSIE